MTRDERLYNLLMSMSDLRMKVSQSETIADDTRHHLISEAALLHFIAIVLKDDQVLDRFEKIYDQKETTNL